MIWVEIIEKINGAWQKALTIQKRRACIHISLKGEGQFVAKFRYLGENRPAKIPSKKDQLSAEQKKWWQEFAKETLEDHSRRCSRNLWGRTLLGSLGFTRFAQVKLRNGLPKGPSRKIGLNLVLPWALL